MRQVLRPYAKVVEVTSHTTPTIIELTDTAGTIIYPNYIAVDVSGNAQDTIHIALSGIDTSTPIENSTFGLNAAGEASGIPGQFVAGRGGSTAEFSLPDGDRVSAIATKSFISQSYWLLIQYGQVMVANPTRDGLRPKGD